MEEVWIVIPEGEIYEALRPSRQNGTGKQGPHLSRFGGMGHLPVNIQKYR